MKKSYLLLALFFVANIFAQNIKIDLKPQKTELKDISETKAGISFNVKIDKFIVSNKEIKSHNFFIMQDSKFVKNQEIGSPNIPVLTELIEIPLGANVQADISNIKQETINLSEFGINKQLAPVQRSMSKNESEDDVPFTKNDNIYNSNSFYSKGLVNIEVLGIFRDKRIARIVISPFEYNPVTNEIKATYEFSVNISFVHPDYEATNKLKAKTASPYYYSTSKFTLNNIENQSKDAITQYPVKMVIVADPMFKSQLQPYIQWKTKKGFTVIEAYTDDSNVGTTTSSIKSYLKNIYNSATASDPAPSFVLLVGDIAQIPAFDGTTESHKTDLYYCEYTNDFFPEIYYGRWSAQSTAQLQPQIDKTLEYEQYLMPDPSYLENVLLVAGVDQEDGDPNGYSGVHGNGQLEYGMKNYFNSAHGISVYKYLYPLSDEPASEQSIKDDFNKGVGFVNYTAHCSPEGWSNPSFTTSDVPNITNNHKYCLMIGNCCQSNTFSENECFGEALLRKANGGTVGYIGGANITFWDEDYHWGVGAQNIQSNPPVNYDANALGAYDKVFHDHGEAESKWFVTNDAIIIGGNFAVEQAGDEKHNYYWEVYHLMGDPSIMNYFGVPAALTANYSSAISIGETSLTVNTEKYAYVAISQNNVLLDAKYTGSNTSVTLNFPAFTSTGTADIVITKQNRQPHISTIDIIANNINNDALVDVIIEPLANYSCPDITVTPKVVIKNLGQNQITSVNVKYKFDGGSEVTYNWTGNLSSLETDTVTFTENINLSIGSHTFSAYTRLPNGVTDENPGNDEKTVNIKVEDVATVADFVADETESCVAPFDVNFTNNSQNADSYLWDFGDGNTSTDQNPSHTYTSQGAYTVSLTAKNAACGDVQKIKQNYIIISDTIPCEYCDAGSNDDSYEGISNVKFNTIDNSSENSTYTDFTNISTNIYAEQTYTLTVTVNNSYDTDELTCWIDWNRDGDFYDTGEEISLNFDSNTEIGTVDITVPTTASNGKTRMRIRLLDTNSGSSAPCGFTSEGEVEDYTLNIFNDNLTSANSCINNIFEVYPNPNNGLFNIISSSNKGYVSIYNVAGEIIYSGEFNSYNTQISLNNIENGIYFIEIKTINSINKKKIIVK